MTTISPTLFKAILSMDSYNRGYNRTIELPTVVSATEIGNATIVAAIDPDDTLALDIGFYALAYDVRDENNNFIETVISYRGTDYPDEDTSLIPDDIYHGWSLGGGFVDSEQGRMAVDFYNQVVDAKYGTSIQANHASIDISLVGHSLGGGLSGFVGALYDQDAKVFDSMAYQFAASEAYYYSTTAPIVDTVLKEKIYASATPWVNNYTGIDAYSLEGEVLYANNFIMMNKISENDQTVYSLGSGVDLIPNTPASLVDYNDLMLAISAQYITNAAAEAIARHSISSLVIRLFAEETEVISSNWTSAAKYFWPLLYSNNFAQQIGIGGENVQGKSLDDKQYADILRTTLAYSAIDDGALVFGDTAIRAFYDDANELGDALEDAEVGSKVELYATDISKAFVNFAGLLALSKIEDGAWDNPYLAKEGILTYSAGNHLTVNFDNTLWEMANTPQDASSSAGMPAMPGQAALIGKFLDETGEEEYALREAMGTLWGDTSTNIFNSMIFAFNGSFSIPAIPGASTEATLFVGSDYANYVTGSEDHDLIWGGEGDDVIYGSTGQDILHGGAHFDTVDYSGIAAFIDVTDKGNYNYEVKKYLGQMSATGSYVTDYLYSIENIVGGTNSPIQMPGGAGGHVVNGNASNNSLSHPNGYNIAVSMYGREGHDDLYGWRKDDYLDGGTGNDYVQGNEGNDVFIYRRGDGNDYFSDNLGWAETDIETLIMQGISSSEVTLHRNYCYLCG